MGAEEKPGAAGGAPQSEDRSRCSYETQAVLLSFATDFQNISVCVLSWVHFFFILFRCFEIVSPCRTKSPPHLFVLVKIELQQRFGYHSLWSERVTSRVHTDAHHDTIMCFLVSSPRSFLSSSQLFNFNLFRSKLRSQECSAKKK